MVIVATLPAIAAVAVLGAEPDVGAPQEFRLVTSRPACTSCVLHTESVVTLGSLDDPVGITPSSRLARDSRGRYYVAPTDRAGVIAVYDQSGSFLAAIGARGQGPGEFLGPDFVVIGPADTLFVFDGPRLSVLSPDYRFARSVPLPGRTYDAVWLRSGVLVLNVLPGATRGAAPLLQVLAGDSVQRVFGPLLGPNLQGIMPFLRLAPSSSGGIWSVPFNAYRIEHWDERGTRTAALRRDPDWFRSQAFAAPDPAASVVMGLYQDSEGLLWVSVRVARDGRRAFPSLPGERQPPTPSESLANFGTQVEVIDPFSGTLVTSARLDRLVSRFLGDGLACGFRESQDGVLSIEVFTLRLRR